MAEDITQMLLDAQQGDAEARERVYAIVYEELRRLAHAQLSRKPGSTLGTTALVHEAFIKLCDQSRLDVKDRSHFMCLSARAMRHILVDHFRQRSAGKRGGRVRALSLDEASLGPGERGEILLDLDEALEGLSALNPRLGLVVECRFFGGMTQPQIAEALGISERTVQSDWLKAKAYLARELGRGDAGG